METRIKNHLVKITKIGTIIFVLLASYRTLFVEPVYWSGVYYPHGDLVGNAIYSPRFQYKEECIGWAINERGLRPEDKNVPLKDLWECNKNCRLSSAYANLVNAPTRENRQELVNDSLGPSYLCDDGGFDGEDWLRGDF